MDSVSVNVKGSKIESKILKRSRGIRDVSFLVWRLKHDVISDFLENTSRRDGNLKFNRLFWN